MSAKEGFIEKEDKKARKVSIVEGSFSSASGGFGDSFVIPFAQAIGSNAMHIGLLSAFSGLLSPISQYFGNRLMEKQPRKKIVAKYVLLQSLMWLPLAFIAYLFWAKSITSFLPWLLIIGYTLIAVFGGLAHPAWFSWMGDIVPAEIRGKYFSKRNGITGLVGIIVALIGSLIIKKFEILGWTMFGFGILFFLAFVFRFAAFGLFKKQFAPAFKLEKKDEFSLLAFLKRFDNFGKYSVYRAVFNFAIMIASPFFGFYLLTEIGLDKNLFLFTVISLSSSIFTIMFNPLAGKFSDKYGNLKLLYIEWIFFVLSPVVWLFSKNIYWLILAPGIVAGIANSAAGIANANFIFDSVSQAKRGTCTAYTNILIGVGVFLGSTLGGFLLKYLQFNSLGINAFLLVFVLAAVARFIVGILFLPKIKEVRKVSSLRMHIHPIKAIHHEFHGLGLFITGKHGHKR